MRNNVLPIVSMFFVAALLACNPPSKPPDPAADAGIDTKRSLTFLDALHDSIVAGQTYACTVYINKPAFIESVFVSVSRGAGDSAIYSGALKSTDSIVLFSLRLFAAAAYDLKVLVVKSNGSRDSMTLPVVVTGSADPADLAGIDRQRTLRNLTALRDSLRNDRTYPCTLWVAFPKYIDSCRIKIDGSLLLATPSVHDTILPFPLQIGSAGAHTISIAVYKKNGGVDTLTKTFTVFEPALSRITSIRPVEGAFTFGGSFPCTVLVSLPAQADSFYARLVYGASDSLIQRGAIGGPQIIFSVPVRVVGGFALRVKIKRTEGTWDSAGVSYTGLAVGTPAVTPDSAVFHGYLHDSVRISFTVTDPDSNLWRCSTWVALPSSLPLAQFYPPKSASVRYSRTFFANSFGPGSFVVFAQATDFSNQSSVAAACTVKVIDTIPPSIIVLPPFNQPLNTVASLPVTLRALVTDDSPIDSVRFNASAMAISGDTAAIVISALPTGASADTIAAWDHSGVKASVIVNFTYSGPVKYPPQIRPMGRTVKEGATIDTIWLDTCVALTLPPEQVSDPVAYKRDSLFWKVTGESGLFKISFDSVRHRVYIALPDTQLRIGQAVSEALLFRVTDSRGETDQEIGVMLMTGVNGAPVVTMKNQTVCGNAPFDTLLLDTCYKDPEDTAGSAVQWEFTEGKVFKVMQLQTCRNVCMPPPSFFCSFICLPNGKIAIIPDPAKIAPDSATKWRGSDTLSFRVKDLDGAWSAQKKVVFTRQTVCFIKDPIITLPKQQASLPKRADR